MRSSTALARKLAPKASEPDADIIDAAEKWQALETQIRGLLAERARRRALVPTFFNKVCNFDPRETAVNEKSLRDFGFEHIALLEAFKPIFAQLGLGEIEDELGRLWNEQTLIAEFLVREAVPTTMAGAVAVIGVAFGCLSQDQLLNDPPRSSENDWDVEHAVAGRDALALAMKLLRNGGYVDAA